MLTIAAGTEPREKPSPLLLAIKDWQRQLVERKR